MPLYTFFVRNNLIDNQNKVNKIVTSLIFPALIVANSCGSKKVKGAVPAILKY